jgi:hypothetical protein
VYANVVIRLVEKFSVPEPVYDAAFAGGVVPDVVQLTLTLVSRPGAVVGLPGDDLHRGVIVGLRANQEVIGRATRSANSFTDSQEPPGGRGARVRGCGGPVKWALGRSKDVRSVPGK